MRGIPRDILFTDRGTHYVFSEKASLILHKNVGELSRTHLAGYQIRNREALLVAALQMARSYYPALRLNNDIKIEVVKGTVTGNNKIMLSLDVFDKEHISPYQKVDVFMGEFIHEAGIFLFTDFVYADEKLVTPISQALWTILEAEYTERRIGSRFPGYAVYLRALREFMFIEKFNEHTDRALTQLALMKINDPEITFRYFANNLYDEDIEMIEKTMESCSIVDTFEDKNAEQLYVFLLMVRYPAQLTLELVRRNIDFIRNVKSLLKPFPDSSSACVDMAIVLENELFSAPPEQPPFPVDGEGSGDEQEEGENTDDEQPEENEQFNTLRENTQRSVEEVCKNITDTFGIGDYKPMVDETEGMGDIMSMVEDILMSPDDRGGYQAGAYQTGGEEDGDSFNNSPSMNCQLSEDGKTMFYFMRNPDNEAIKKSMEAHKCTGEFGRVLRKFLERDVVDHKLVLKGMHSGRFDTNKIVEAHLGVPTIYKRFDEIKSSKIAVVFLLDQSASMKATTNGRFKPNDQLVREVAATCDAALYNIPDIEYFMYGFTADGIGCYENTIFIYREPGVNVQHNIGEIKGKWNNRDHVAIREVCNRVRKFTQNPAVFIMISDGNPCAADYGGDEAFAAIKKEVEIATVKKFQVVHIAIGQHAGSDAEKVYPHIIHFESIADLPQQIGKMMRIFLRKKLKPII